MGKFVSFRGKLMHYEAGDKHVVRGVNPDMWSYSKALGIVREFKYDGEVKVWWKPKKGRMDKDLRQMSVDMDALELANYA